MTPDGASETGRKREMLTALFRHHHGHEGLDCDHAPTVEFYVDGKRLDLRFSAGTYGYRTDAIEKQARFVELCKWQDALTLSADDERTIRARQSEWSPGSALERTADILDAVLDHEIADLSRVVEVDCPDHRSVTWSEFDEQKGFDERVDGE